MATRGQMLFIKNGRAFLSTEFNGDMIPDDRGAMCIDGLEDCEDVEDFDNLCSEIASDYDYYGGFYKDENGKFMDEDEVEEDERFKSKDLQDLVDDEILEFISVGESVEISVSPEGDVTDPTGWNIYPDYLYVKIIDDENRYYNIKLDCVHEIDIDEWNHYCECCQGNKDECDCRECEECHELFDPESADDEYCDGCREEMEEEE